jgi:hypothetical protein
MYKNILIINKKKKIANELYNYSLDEIKEDFLKLKEIKCSNVNVKSLIGNKLVNYFTAYERLDVIGSKNINFYDFLTNINTIKKKKSYISLENYYGDKKKPLLINYDYCRLYSGCNVAIFKPIIAKQIYCMFKPTSILDFTMGWGGRMVGACSLDIPNYIGIDLNKDLKTPIKNMYKFISPHTETKVNLIFKNALDVDYSKLYYDLVLTSPPYYNIEQYKYNKRLSKEEWDNNFYIPIITKTYKYLQPKGVYCLNIPDDVYDVIKTVLGKAHKKIEMHKNKRRADAKKEWIYIWFK